MIILGRIYLLHLKKWKGKYCIMGKIKNYIKEETVNRINSLLKKYKTKESMKESKEFQSLETHYINTFERKNMDKIIDLCCSGKTYDEIRFIIGGTTMSEANKKKSKDIDNVNYDKDIDPVERESVFLISQQRVVETEPVEVIIGGVNGQNGAAENAVNTDTKYHSDFISSLESDIDHMFAEAEKNSNSVKDVFKKMSLNTEVPDEPYRRQNFHLPTFMNDCEKKFNEYEDKVKKFFEKKTA